MVRTAREGKEPHEATPQLSDAVLTNSLTYDQAAMAKAYEQGLSAHGSGQPIEANPYDLHSNETAMLYMNWVDGWQTDE
jgi:hypothetical protein